MEEIMLLTLMGVWNIAIYRLGLRDGGRMTAGRPLWREKEKRSPEAERIHTIMENIDRYNGTAKNQKAVKRLEE